ncbi:hypothetical protein BV898_03498 [Hypsibius exemplaris]|uniref:Uncharacterized protein n=1 Tax=Hypsibius exemplaris TaxID=2072580 RepID=A0A1W0X5B5_HYPEX|nr:hypothetical protein BV898_03498 [Hypsibius exemplaris]
MTQPIILDYYPRNSCRKQDRYFVDSSVKQLDQGNLSDKCFAALALPVSFLTVHPLSRPDFPLVQAWLKPEAARFGEAPRKIPGSLRNGYSMNGIISIREFYFDNAYLGGSALTSVWSLDTINDLRARVRARQTYFNYDSSFVYQALDAHGKKAVSSRRGLVIGSEKPWLEVFLLEYGADHVTTLEFGAIISQHPQIRTFTPANFTAAFLQGQIEPFDFLFTYSSIEHDGLGRYGDVLNPSGDLETMARMLSVVKPGGYAFVGIPCCFDALDWNAHRTYGHRRLAMLFAGWRVVGVFPANALNQSRKPKLRVRQLGSVFQPVWVLQNVMGCVEQKLLGTIAGIFKE